MAGLVDKLRGVTGAALVAGVALGSGLYSGVGVAEEVNFENHRGNDIYSILLANPENDPRDQGGLVIVEDNYYFIGSSKEAENVGYDMSRNLLSNEDFLEECGRGDHGICKNAGLYPGIFTHPDLVDYINAEFRGTLPEDFPLANSIEESEPVEDLSISVPEPSNNLMLAAGIFGLSYFARRRGL